MAKVHRISAPQPWRVERSEIWEKTGLNKKYFGTIEPRQDYMTATCGPLIYRETAFPPSIAATISSARRSATSCTATCSRAPAPVRSPRGRPKVASSWPRPTTGAARSTWRPDRTAAIYVVDMYRQLIEHAGPDGGRDVPNVPLEILRKYGLRTGSTMGRIYRVAPAGLARERSRAWTAPRQGTGRRPGIARRLVADHGPAADPGEARSRRGRGDHRRRSYAAPTRRRGSRRSGPSRRSASSTTASSTALRDESPGVRENALRMAEGRLGRKSRT